MNLVSAVRRGDWQVVFGYAFFVALLTGGYYYNVTFVQLGLLDLGTRLVGLSEAAVSGWMATLALVTLATAIAFGVSMDRRGWSSSLDAKLRILLGVVVAQVLLTAAAPFVRTAPQFGAWIILASVSMGVGFPATFALTIDFVAVRDRGAVAAAATALTYFLANVYPLNWQVESFSRVVVAAMLPGVVLLGVLVFRPPAFVGRLSRHHEQFGVGRFCHSGPVSVREAAFVAPLVLMFGVFFVDSLGFLRILDTPSLVLTSWQSPDFSMHLTLGVVHVVGAVMAGVLYTSFDRRVLFLAAFGLFSFTHLLYTFDIRVAMWFPSLTTGPSSPLNPAFYAVAVSFYTTLNFALWPDLSTPDTIGTHSAIGIGLAGFLSTFLSTALALYFQSTSVTLLDHLNLVNALALLLFVGLVVGTYLGRMHTLWEGRNGEPN
ncbi:MULTISPECIES: MFS transporter [Haloferax]|uniref:MFS transporter n=1 Tax=Haloferax marinum TaxID=2666143 RepID=A0A6A8G3L9_9EURY|nr:MULTISPECIES: MFS transporter [Haloferax]KAB1196362.1 MFS transporter [Haloferax sp. CBA1150]MRW95355.1 MFS transporter [Haloferax marinum]